MEDRRVIDFKYIYREMIKRAKMGDSCYKFSIEKETIFLTDVIILNDAMKELRRRGFNANLYYREDNFVNRLAFTVDWH